MKKHIIFLTISVLIIQFGWAQEQAKVGYKQAGQASYYANKFHGKKTASGEKFDMYAMTAAHPTIPFNSIVKLTNKENDKWVTVRINDRGPFTPRRILDMSKAAALKLDIIKSGVAEIELEVLKIPGEETTSSADIKEEADKEKTSNGSTAAKEEVPSKEEVKEKPKEKVVTAKNETDKKVVEKPEEKPLIVPKETSTKKVVAKNTEGKTKEKPTKVTDTKANNTVANNTSLPLSERFQKVQTYNVWGTIKQPKGYGVQLGSYNDIQKALDIGNEAGTLGMKEVYIQTGWAEGNMVYRVLFASGNEENVKRMLPIVKSKGFPGAFLRAHY